MPAPLSYIYDKDVVSFAFNSSFKSFNLSTEQGKKVLAALQKTPQDLDEIATLSDMAMYIAKVSFGRIQIDDKDRLRLDGRLVDYGLKDVMLRCVNEEAGVDHLTKFIEKVDANPDKNVSEHLYAFLVKGRMPITPDGNFLAFKRVDKNRKSFWSGKEEVAVTTPEHPTAVVYKGKIPHPPGATLTMDRSVCNPNRNQTCSVGLHACSYAYLPTWYSQEGILLIVEIDPADVTAVPNEYQLSKLRTCRYRVVSEINESEAAGHFQKPVDTRYTPGWQDQVVEPEKDVLVEVADILRLAQEDGEHDAYEDGIFICDPESGNQSYDVPEEYWSVYYATYCSAYTNAYELDEFYSERAYKAGFEDGGSDASAASRETFEPNFKNGRRYEACSAHHDAYSQGYMKGYLDQWGTTC